MNEYSVGMSGKNIKLIKNEEENFSISTRPEYIPITVKIPNKTEVIKLDLEGYPLFVDNDDIVYYERNGFLFMTEDGITETQILTVADLDPVLNRVDWFCKTRKNGKYILSLRRHTENKGQIWTADNLEGPWTKKIDVQEVEGLGNSHFRFSNCWHHFDGITDIIIMATYGNYEAGVNTSPCNHVYLSLDEGETFNLIFEAPTILATSNNHIHAVAYSPWNGWIWVTYGDNDNRGISYSYDKGVNWVKLSEGDFGKGGWQPTSIVPLINQVSFGTDNPIANGVLGWFIPSITEPSKIDYMWQKLHFDGTVFVTRRGAQISANEGYIPIIQSGTTTIVVTGDGGVSWHPAVTFAEGLPFEYGFTNPDSQGYVYGASMLKFKVTEWTETTKWVKNRFVK